MPFRIALWFLFVLFLSPLYSEEFSWKILDFKGNVSINGSAITSLANEVFVKAGDTITTDVNSEISFFISKDNKSSTILLLAGSILEYQNKSGIFFYLKKGEIFFNLETDFSLNPIHLKTDSSFMRATGTAFYVNDTGGLESELHVIDGLVKVSRNENMLTGFSDFRLAGKGEMIRSHILRGPSFPERSPSFIIQKLNQIVNDIQNSMNSYYKKTTESLESKKEKLPKKKIKRAPKITEPIKELDLLAPDEETMGTSEEEIVIQPEIKKEEYEKEKIEINKEKENDVIKNDAETDDRYYWEIVKNINDVQIQKNGSSIWIKSTIGEKVFEGDSIKVGEKSGVLLFIRGLNNKDSFTQIFENSLIKVINLNSVNLDQLEEVYLDLILGEVLVNVENLPSTSTFQVKTPVGVAAVRGTLFSILNTAEGFSRTTVLRGSIAIGNEIVNAGEVLNMAENGESKKEEASSEDLKKYEEQASENIKTVQEHAENQNENADESKNESDKKKDSEKEEKAENDRKEGDKEDGTKETKETEDSSQEKDNESNP
ncbi:MAG: hypothetical protein ACD_79C00452G0001, partial [uncultured bacterium]